LSALVGENFLSVGIHKFEIQRKTYERCVNHFAILVVSKAVPRKLSFSDLRMIVDHLFIGVTNLNKRLKFFTTFENN